MAEYEEEGQQQQQQQRQQQQQQRVSSSGSAGMAIDPLTGSMLSSLQLMASALSEIMAENQAMRRDMRALQDAVHSTHRHASVTNYAHRGFTSAMEERLIPAL
jgi:transcription initiation factor TFIID subunit TAF12